MALIAEIKNEQGQSLGIVVLAPKVYSTGSQGYFGNGKLTNTDGKAAAVQVQWVIVHSNPDGEKTENYDPDFFAVQSKAQAKSDTRDIGNGEDDANAGRDVMERVHPAFAKMIEKTVNPKSKTTKKVARKKSKK